MAKTKEIDVHAEEKAADMLAPAKVISSVNDILEDDDPLAPDFNDTQKAQAATSQSQ